MWGTSAAGVDLGQADPCIARRQDRRSHTSEVPRRTCSRAGGVAGVCGTSVGTGADVSAPAEPAGRSGIGWWDASSGHGRAGPRRLDVGERRLPTEHRVRRSNLFGDQARPPGSWQVAYKPLTVAQPKKPPNAGLASSLTPDRVPPRCPPRTKPRRTDGQLATHATHRPVTGGTGTPSQ